MKSSHGSHVPHFVLECEVNSNGANRDLQQQAEQQCTWGKLQRRALGFVVSADVRATRTFPCTRIASVALQPTEPHAVQRIANTPNRGVHLVKFTPVAINRLPELHVPAKQSQLLALCCTQLLLLTLQVGHVLLLRHHPAALNSSIDQQQES
jgi:hypothetical protein